MIDMLLLLQKTTSLSAIIVEDIFTLSIVLLQNQEGTQLIFSKVDLKYHVCCCLMVNAWKSKKLKCLLARKTE